MYQPKPSKVMVQWINRIISASSSVLRSSGGTAHLLGRKNNVYISTLTKFFVATGTKINIDSARKECCSGAREWPSLPIYTSRRSVLIIIHWHLDHNGNTMEGQWPDRAPLLTSFPYWHQPKCCTSFIASLLDFWLLWGSYLGLGIGLQDFVLGGLVAGIVAILGIIFQAYR